MGAFLKEYLVINELIPAREDDHILRCILSCKSDCHPIFGITLFVTQIVHVSRHVEVEGRKQNIKLRKICF